MPQDSGPPIGGLDTPLLNRSTEESHATLESHKKRKEKKTSSFVLSRMLTESVLAPPRAPVDAFPNYCQITIRCFHKPYAFAYQKHSA